MATYSTFNPKTGKWSQHQGNPYAPAQASSQSMIGQSKRPDFSNYAATLTAPTTGMGTGVGNKYSPSNLNSPFISRWGAAVPTDASGRPVAPEFTTVGDAQTGLLKTPYNVQTNLNSLAMDQLRSEALRPAGEMSRWGQLALAQSQDQAMRGQLGAQSAAQNQLAQSGGLRSGARERIAQQGMQNRLLTGQNVLQNVQLQDEQNRQKLLQAQPGNELQQAGYLSGIEGQNINRALGEILQKRAAQQGQFSEAMRGWASERTAAATPSSSGKK